MPVRIEAGAVVLDGQLHEVGLLRELHRHVAGAGVLIHVFQGFLKNAVKRELGVGGQPGGQLHAGQFDGHSGAMSELRAGGAKDGFQSQFVQHAGPEVAGDALHFLGRLAEHLAEFHRLERRQFLHERLATKEDGAEQLGDVVVQFEGHAPALGLLHLQHAVGQGPQQLLVAPGLRHVRHDHADRHAFKADLGDFLDRDLHRQARAVGGDELHLQLGAGLGDVLHERPERGTVLEGNKPAEGTARHLFERELDHAREASVGVKDRLVGGERERAFVHGLDEHTVGVLGSCQGEYLRALLARADDGIHFSVADGAEGFLGFGQASAESGKLAGLRGKRGGFPPGGF